MPTTGTKTRTGIPATLRFRQMKSLQKFAAAHAAVHNHFASERDLVDQQT
jgi:putative transposase